MRKNVTLHITNVKKHKSVIDLEDIIDFDGIKEPLKDIECDKCSFKMKVGINIHGVIWCPMCGNVLVDGYLCEDDGDN